MENLALFSCSVPRLSKTGKISGNSLPLCRFAAVAPLAFIAHDIYQLDTKGQVHPDLDTMPSFLHNTLTTT